MDKGLLFYYDWLMPLSRLTDEEFRYVVNTMVNYHKCEFEIPPIEGNVGLTLDFIIPQINRMKENVKNGKKGGRPKKEESIQDSITHNKEEKPTASDNQTDDWDMLIRNATKKREALAKERRARAILKGDYQVK